MSNYALRVPDSLFEVARKLAEADQTSMNQFFVTAIAEKISALETERFFKEGGKGADRKRYLDLLDKIPDRGPDPHRTCFTRRSQAPKSERSGCPPRLLNFIM